MNWIAVADTSALTLQVAGQILCKNKMRMTGFVTGQGLMDFLKDNKPDLILLGNVMWELGGFESISTLRRVTRPGSGIPVILMMDPENRDLEETALASGAAGVVFKPLAPAILTKCVTGILSSQEHCGDEASPWNNLEEIAATLEECNDSSHGMWMGKEAFGNVYRHMLRYLERFHNMTVQVLFTVEFSKEPPAYMRTEIITQFRRQLQRSLRNSDIMLENGDNQFFVLLPEVREADIGLVISDTINEWKGTEYGSFTDIASEVRRAWMNSGDAAAGLRDRADWIVIVDDDVTILKMAGRILSQQHMRVIALRSGKALLDYVKENRPDAILLDKRMPDMDGFETMRRLKKLMVPGQEIPVIFLTADDNAEAEKEGLELGAMDFIKKPFVPGVLTQRLRHIIDLDRLQKNLANEVALKTQENESLSLHVVQTLAEAIDAKDTYTNGHSSRVAEYAREIARRFGYNRTRQDEIYMMSLLHDVGKIGVPDSVINKPGKLTAEEYDQIKAHPVMGDRILKKIKEKPRLAIGARWHHERYDGTGYPDGLSGAEIPEEARIIAVADAYDAMTSYRSYRSILTQETVRREIEEGKETQFDPTFADIMLQIIADDPEYRLKEG